MLGSMSFLLLFFPLSRYFKSGFSTVRQQGGIPHLRQSFVRRWLRGSKRRPDCCSTLPPPSFLGGARKIFLQRLLPPPLSLLLLFPHSPEAITTTTIFLFSFPGLTPPFLAGRSSHTTLSLPAIFLRFRTFSPLFSPPRPIQPCPIASSSFLLFSPPKNHPLIVADASAKNEEREERESKKA